MAKNIKNWKPYIVLLLTEYSLRLDDQLKQKKKALYCMVSRLEGRNKEHKEQ
jgi:hypothetical protein